MEVVEAAIPYVVWEVDAGWDHRLGGQDPGGEAAGDCLGPTRGRCRSRGGRSSPGMGPAISCIASPNHRPETTNPGSASAKAGQRTIEPSHLNRTSEPADYLLPWRATGGGAFSRSVPATCCASCSMLKGFATNGQPVSSRPDSPYPDMSRIFILGQSAHMRWASLRPSINGMTTSTRSRSISPGRFLPIRMASSGSMVCSTAYPTGSRAAPTHGPTVGSSSTTKIVMMRGSDDCARGGALNNEGSDPNTLSHAS
jgi:hypothetical protein